LLCTKKERGMKKFRIALGLVAALAMIGMVSISDARADFDSDICNGSPTDAAEEWTSSFPDGDTPEECAKVCKTWRKTCDGAVKAVAKCHKSAISLSSKLSADDDCRYLESSDERRACNNEVKENRTKAYECLEENLEEAKSWCQSYEGDCLDDCN